MILLDVENQQKSDTQVAGSTIRLPEPSVAGRSTSSSLPDYESSQAQYAAPLFKLPRKRVDNRFWKATLLALAIYVALSVIIGVPMVVFKAVKPHIHGPPIPWPREEFTSSQNLKSLTTLAKNEFASCDVWHSTQDTDFFTATAHRIFSPSGSFAIHSDNGVASDKMSGFLGQLIVDINDDPSVTSAIIYVSLNSSNAEQRARTHFCFVDQGSSRGLYILVPNNISPTESLSLTIRLLFPASSSLLTIDNIVTRLPMFTQSLGGLGNKIFIRKMDIEGAGMNIFCNIVSAQKAILKNSLASISGTFNISEGLSIDTVSGPVLANITLVQGPGSKAPTYFSIETGNSMIDAQVILKAPHAGFVGHPTTFLGSIKAFSSPLSVNILHEDSTPSVPIDLFVQNNQATTNITIDSKFIGKFDARTKLASVTLDEGSKSMVGSRTRQFIFDNKSLSRKSGWVGVTKPTRWNPTEHGRLLIESSLSPILLGIGS
uniref:Uncharacterized protein n=1 Tax=Moniliophthora roreri TaxID=221103 RepID=A0A0W0F0H0_MONRR